MNILGSAGLSILEHLFSIGAGLVASANPEFGPIISLVESGIENEIASIGAGNPITLLGAVENVAPGAVALSASLVARNNPKDAPALGSAVSAIIAAIPAAPAPTPPSTPAQ